MWLPEALSYAHEHRQMGQFPQSHTFPPVTNQGVGILILVFELFQRQIVRDTKKTTPLLPHSPRNEVAHGSIRARSGAILQAQCWPTKACESDT